MTTVKAASKPTSVPPAIDIDFTQTSQSPVKGQKRVCIGRS